MSLRSDGLISTPSGRKSRRAADSPVDLQRLMSERCAASAAVAARLDTCSDSLLLAADLLVEALTGSGKVLTCGNGGSASEAQHFAAELVGRFRCDRAALAAIALTTDPSTVTAIANDYGFADVFARQVDGLGRPGDVLVAISTSGESENVVRAAWTARNLGMAVVAMTGERPSRLADISTVALQVPSDDTPTIQEFQMMFTHLPCEAVEAAFIRHKVRP